MACTERKRRALGRPLAVTELAAACSGPGIPGAATNLRVGQAVCSQPLASFDSGDGLVTVLDRVLSFSLHNGADTGINSQVTDGAKIGPPLETLMGGQLYEVQVQVVGCDANFQHALDRDSAVLILQDSPLSVVDIFGG